MLGALLLLAIAVGLAVQRRQRSRAQNRPIAEREKIRLIIMLTLRKRHKRFAGKLQTKSIQEAKKIGLQISAGDFEDAIEFLDGKGLIKEQTSEWIPQSLRMNRVIRLTAAGADEVDRGFQDQDRPTEHLMAHKILVTGTGAIVNYTQGDNSPIISNSPNSAAGKHISYNGPECSIDTAEVAKFVQEYRTLLRAMEVNAGVSQKVAAQLQVIDAEVQSDKMDEAEVRRAGKSAIDFAGKVGIGVASKAAFEALASTWHHFFN